MVPLHRVHNTHISRHYFTRSNIDYAQYVLVIFVNTMASLNIATLYRPISKLLEGVLIKFITDYIPGVICSVYQFFLLGIKLAMYHICIPK
jgi:hypothetical protein